MTLQKDKEKMAKKNELIDSVIEVLRISSDLGIHNSAVYSTCTYVELLKKSHSLLF